MLEKMSKAGAAFSFVTRTDVVVDGHRNYGNGAVLAQYDAQAVSECEFVNRSWW